MDRLVGVAVTQRKLNSGDLEDSNKAPRPRNILPTATLFSEHISTRVYNCRLVRNYTSIASEAAKHLAKVLL